MGLITILLVLLIVAVATIFAFKFMKIAERTNREDSLEAHSGGDGPAEKQTWKKKHKKPMHVVAPSALRSAVSQKHPVDHVLERVTKHPLYLNTLKGFSGRVTCVAVCRTTDFVAASCTDRTIRVFDLRGEKLNSENPPFVRGTLEGEHCTAIDFTHDGSHIVGALESFRTMVMVKVAKDASTGKHMTVVRQGSVGMQKGSVRWLIASKGRWIVTASEEDDTVINIWNYDGDRLASYDTKQVQNFQLCTSLLDGRFIACSAWSPGVKIMEIKSKNFEFVKLERAMDLKSDKGIKAVCLSPDHRYAVTGDKTGLITLWSIDVRYHVSEDPKPIKQVEETDPQFQEFTLLECTCDKYVVCVSVNRIKIRELETLKEVGVIEEASTVPVRHSVPSALRNFFVVGAGDSRPRIWSTPT